MVYNRLQGALSDVVSMNRRQHQKGGNNSNIDMF